MESNIDELIGQYTEEMQRRYEEAVESGISKGEDTVSYKSQSSAGISSAEAQTKPQNLKTIVYAPLADSKIAPGVQEILLNSKEFRKHHDTAMRYAEASHYAFRNYTSFIKEVSKANKKRVKDFLENRDNRIFVNTIHKNTDLEFHAMSVKDFNDSSHVEIYKSPTYHRIQSSAYKIGFVDGELVYMRKSNHWGKFQTNIVEGTPEGDEYLRGLSEKERAQIPDDPYGRIGIKFHHWKITGGNESSRASQAGYIRLKDLGMQDLPFGIPASVQPEDFFSLIRGVRAIRRAERTAKYSKSQSENLKSVGEGVGISGAEERKHDNIIVNKRTGETLKEAIQDLKEYQDGKYIEGFKRTHIALHNTTPHYIKVYHGTNNDFERFDAKFIGSQTDDGIWGRGFYFAPTERLAKNALHGGNAKYIKEVFVNKSKLLDLKQYTNKEEFAEYLGISEDILVQTEGMYRPTMSYINTFTSAIQQLGYEGVYVDRGETSSELVIFDESNIIYKEEDIPKNPQEAEVIEYKKKSGYSTKFENNTILRELTKREQQFVENYTKLTNGEVEKVEIAEGIIDEQGNTDILLLGIGRDEKIKNGHGNYAIENLIITVHDAEIVLGNIERAENKLNYIKLLDGENFLLVSAQKKSDNHYVITHFPIRENGRDYIQNLVKDGAKVLKNSSALELTDGSRKSRDAEEYESIISENEGNASENYKSTGGNEGISAAESRGNGERSDFKLSERIKAVIAKLNTNYTRYVAKGSVGTFYGKTNNIALRSINLSTGSVFI